MNFRQIKQKEITQQSGELDEFISDSLLCCLLKLRSIHTKQDALEFLSPKEQLLSPLDVFCDSQKVLDRIKKAISNKEKILIWGDFDADGVTSSALLCKTFKALGADFENFIPNREEHGHGLNSKVIVQLAAKHKIKLLITVDCGISNVKEVSLLKGIGIDTIITDHHKAESDMPDAYAILNPQAPGSLKEDLSVRQITDLSRLAGVGVAYKLALELLKEEKSSDIKEQCLILATVGTISDVVPLLGENRTIVSKGLELINQKKHKGIAKLFENNNRNNITSTDIAFILAPRINAVGRLSTPDLAFDFLTQDSDSSLNFIIEKLDNFNKIRQSLCENIYLEARDMILGDKNFKNQKALILFKQDWHIGIIGIVASKLAEEFLKPVFMVSSGEGSECRCSIRSIGDYNVYEILKKNSDLFLGYGGHALAGGFSFDTSINSFEKVKDAILSTFEELPQMQELKNYIEADKFLEAKEINKELLETIEKLEPFGQNNPAPLFAIKDAELISSRQMGKNSNHLKFICQKDGIEFECVKWNEQELNLPPKSTIDVAFSPRLNEFNGREIIQLNVEDVFCEAYASKTGQNGLKIYDHRKKSGILAQIAGYVKRDNIDITVWAKKIQTVKDLSKYPEIEERFCADLAHHDGVMFFDYPSNYEELKEILNQIKPHKIHLMNDNFDKNIDNYIKSVTGMLKYSHNQKNGEINIHKMAQAIGVSEVFIQIILEIFEGCGSIEICDIDKINYIAPASVQSVSNHPMFEVLVEEFNKILEFKKHLAEIDIDKMHEILVNQI